MALTLQQICDWASRRVPNAETQVNMCLFLDSLQRELYRQFEFPEETQSISTVAGQMFYTLPADIEPSRIKHITITNSDGTSPEPCYHRNPEDELNDYRSRTVYDVRETLAEDLLVIYPIPTTTGNLIITPQVIILIHILLFVDLTEGRLLGKAQKAVNCPLL